MKTKPFNFLESSIELEHLLKLGRNFAEATIIIILMSSFNTLIPTKAYASVVVVDPLNDYAFSEVPELDITQSLLLCEGTFEPDNNVPSELPELDITQNLLLGN